MKVLVTGATGYIGRHLVPRLLDAGHEIRALSRAPRKVRRLPWSDRVEVVRGDLLNLESLYPALKGVDAAYYLVHSMYQGRSFPLWDRQCAENFIAAGERLQRVIYLGGLTPREQRDVSAHLSSRAEVGQLLRDALPTLEFQAGPVLGRGSASYDMIHHVVSSFPVLVRPPWAKHIVHTIAVDDMLGYLASSLEGAATGVIQVGSEAHPFLDLMRIYAEERGLFRPVVPAPPINPDVAALGVYLFTPVSLDIAEPLLHGALHDLPADTRRAREVFPLISPRSYRESIRAAIAAEQEPTP